MKFTTSLFLLVITLAASAHCGSPAEWRNRTIYQVITDRFWRTNGSTTPCSNIRTYCGGTWKGLTDKLDYIQGMGFDAIWISPVPKNTPNGYHGYWQMDFTKLNENFGTVQDFKNLVSAIHARNMWIMVDVVGNHVGYVPDGGFGFQIITPFNEAKYYHKFCEISGYDFRHNQTGVEICRLEGLPDLNQTVPFVRTYLKNWIHDLVKDYDIDGIRIDTVQEVAKDFWAEYTAAAGVYTVGEVYDTRVDYVAGYQPSVSGLLSYPLFFTIADVYGYGKSAYEIRETLQAYKKAFKDVTVLGTFIDNHDNPRFLNRTSSIKRLQNALAFCLYTEGIPIVYYGTEQGYSGGNDPYNRVPLWPTKLNTATALYKFITTLVKYRKKLQVWSYPQVERYVDNTFYGFSRGKTFIATTNSNAGQVKINVTYHPYNNGDVVCDIFFGTGDCVTITGGVLPVVLNNGQTKIYVPKADL